MRNDSEIKRHQTHIFVGSSGGNAATNQLLYFDKLAVGCCLLHSGGADSLDCVGRGEEGHDVLVVVLASNF